MLRFASFWIRNSMCVENFAKNLDLEDIRDILNQRKRNGGSSFGSIRYSSSSEFIHAFDAITKSFFLILMLPLEKIKMLESVCNIILA